VKLPFEPNHLAQVAGVAALEDHEFLKLTLETNRRSLASFKKAFQELGIQYVPTYCNSLLLLLGSEELAERFFNECLERGLIVRHVKSFGIPEGVRINSGSDADTDFAIEVITDVMVAMKQEPTNRDQGKPDGEDQERKNETYIVPQQD
jgi:histidinol-phosphate aminotransferase